MSGSLSGSKAGEWRQRLLRFEKCRSTVNEFCRQEGVPIAKLALQFSASHPEIPTTMFSSASPESVRRNVRWHEEGCDLEMVEAVRSILAPVLDKEWDYDAAIDRMTEEN